ncbi:type II toxin-antitoxin system RelE/ParE family toxin [Labrys wisconsinensis]|uniref:Plasmid stabilization system protein ParE n=1 Tax=Labrys wisconsinensis TaxID=425677 RepID=A0ABU0JDI3_9HYPH|nr:type II toxin-antitoxin system RelE/ParE family toxin [Labrys wisconsinensis]MDQ0472326.1 plasmid stabilization system protein ParE [Labrys wisconsinensis]
MKLAVTPKAYADMEAIRAYLIGRSPAAAGRVGAAFLDAFRIIAEHPNIGRQLARRVRRFVLPRYPYLVFYKVTEAEVQILAVRHAARRPEGEA